MPATQPGRLWAMTRRYLSRTEVAERIGVKPDTLGRYLLPAPDAHGRDTGVVAGHDR